MFCFRSSNIIFALMILCCRDSSCFLRSSISLYFFLGGTRKKYKEVEHLRLQEESRQQRIISAKQNVAAAEAELENRPPY